MHDATEGEMTRGYRRHMVVLIALAALYVLGVSRAEAQVRVAVMNFENPTVQFLRLVSRNEPTS